MSKISELTDGGSLLPTDFLIAVRSGGNVKVQADDITVDQVNLGDNEFIRLGNAQDLTLVHDASNSIINQAGTGNLLIQKAGATKLTVNASGIDVTGSVTADGLTVQTTGSTTAVLTLNNADGNGTLSQINLGYTADPDHGNIQYTGDMIFTASAAERLRINSAGNLILTAGGSIVAGGANDLILNAGESGTPDIYLQSGSSTKVKIEGSDGSVGIGTTTLKGSRVQATGASASASPTLGSATNTSLLLTNSDVTYGMNFGVINNGNGWIQQHSNTGTAAAYNLLLQPVGGNVGIGTDSPTSYGATATTLEVKGASGSGIGALQLAGADGAVRALLYAGGSTDFVINTQSNHAMGFNTNNARAMTIDASGNLLVGKTASGTANTGAELRNGSSNHAVIATSTSATPLVINRKTNNGPLVNLYKDGVTVGSIGSYNDADLYIGDGEAGVKFSNDNNNIIPWNASANASRDNNTDLGGTSDRFRNLYLSGGAYLGGTGAANKLEDYEEGTHAATLNMASGSVGYGSTSGTYVKVGNQVTYNAWIYVTSLSSPSGALDITLPFAIPATTNRPASMFVANNMTSVTGNVGGWINPNTATLYLVVVNGGVMAALTGANLSVNTELYVTITYNV